MAIEAIRSRWVVVNSSSREVDRLAAELASRGVVDKYVRAFGSFESKWGSLAERIPGVGRYYRSTIGRRQLPPGLTVARGFSPVNPFTKVRGQVHGQLLEGAGCCCGSHPSDAAVDQVPIPANENLERDISELLTCPVGRPSHKPVVWYKGLLYQAASWKTAQRVVAKIEFHFGELFPRIGFIVTNLETDNRTVVRFYNKRGTAEQWIKEGKQAVKMTRLSCHRLRSNEVRLWLSLIAYNLGNLWRRLVLPKKIENWSLTSLQQRRVKTGGRLVKHARYYWLMLAESHLTRRLFGSMVRPTDALATG